MRVKTFRGKSVQQAIARIKAEIGPEAVIMSTKRVPKNRTNPYGEQVFEVTASLPEIAAPVNNPHFKKKIKAFVPPRIDNKGREESMGEFIEELREPSRSVSTPSELHREIQEIKDMLFTLQGRDGLPEYIFKCEGASSVFAKMMDCGISTELAKKIITRSYSNGARSKASAQEFRKKVFLNLMSMIDLDNPFEASEGTIAAAFIGPTGVGKTTTIAKIAADLTINKGKKVGVISIDNYRIGALEQLKTYAAILGIPCLPAFNRAELEKAISRMQSKDVILIDTAGVSSFDEKKIRELKEMFEPTMPVSTHLVLSLTSSRENLMESSSKFSELNPSSYIFTKLDETGKKGVMLDQLNYMNLPVSFVTTGQRVPEDISKAERKIILKKIFTEK